MKNKIKIAILILLFGLLSFLVYNIISKIKHNEEVKKVLQTIPEFSFLTLDGNTYSRENLKIGVPTLLIYFNSTCEFCQHEATSIKENIDLLKNVQILFVSSEEREVINNFSIKYRLNTCDFITFLQDDKDVFTKRFDANSIPYILLYDKDQNLIKKHAGQLNINALTKILP